MTLLRPFGMQPAVGDAAINYSGQEIRQLVRALYRGAGVMGGSSLKVSQRGAGANFSVDIAEGHAAVDGGDTSAQQAYIITNTSDGYNKSTFSTGGTIGAPGSGSRTHRVVAQVKDYRNNAAWGAGTYSWDVLILEDTGSGTPAVPNSAIPLGRITIASGQSSITDANITDDRSILPMAGYSDSWHNLSLLAGWSNRGAPYARASYKLQYLGGGLSVTYLVGEITGGTVTDGTVIAHLPVGWRPQADQHIWCAANGRTANNDPPSVHVTASGDIAIYNCQGANTVFFSGTVQLDATS